MKENLLVDMSLDFAVEAVNICDSIKGHGSIRDQMMRSATSVGANIREANYARSKTDFAAKLQIALKECYETEFWIDLFERTNLASARKRIVKPIPKWKVARSSSCKETTIPGEGKAGVCVSLSGATLSRAAPTSCPRPEPSAPATPAQHLRSGAACPTQLPLSSFWEVSFPLAQPLNGRETGLA